MAQDGADGIKRRTLAKPGRGCGILDGRQTRGLTLNRMLKQVPESWEEQRRVWEFSAGSRAQSPEIGIVEDAVVGVSLRTRY